MKNNGKIVAVVQARTGSSRLPGKVLKEIANKPLLQILLERVRAAKEVDGIIVATSSNASDDRIDDLTGRLGVDCFRGSETDVLDRVLNAAKIAGAEHIIQIWGDTVLIDPDVIDMAVQYYRKSDADCAATCLDKTFVWGNSLLIFPTKVLEEVSKLTQDPADREHASCYIYQHPEKYKTEDVPCPEDIKRPDIRLVVDEAADFELIRTVYENLAPKNPIFKTREIIEFLNDNPKLLEINKNVKQRVVTPNR